MSFDHLCTAAVIEFPYLWSREAQRGETEGRKKRPVDGGRTTVVFQYWIKSLTDDAVLAERAQATRNSQ